MCYFDLRQEQSPEGLRFKRKANAFLNGVRRKARKLESIDFSKLPAHLQSLDAGYSALEHMCETPMTNAVLKSLRKKSADVSFLCGTMCDAAVQEGSKRYMTRTLATITKEARFHSRLASCLPKVELVKFPVQIKKTAHESI